MFVDEFVRLCAQKGPDLARRLRREPSGPIEAAWAAAVRSRWVPLPDGQPCRSRLYAADGSGHSVELANGSFVVVAQAFLAGPTVAEARAAVDLEIAGCRDDPADISSLRDIMMRRLEATVALEAAVAMDDPDVAVLFLDGSIYAELTHLGPAYGWGARWGTATRRVEETLDRYLQLLALAESTGIWVVGVAKTTRATFLSERLRRDGVGGGSEGPGDPELLGRWTLGPGFAHPVVLARDGLRGTPSAVLSRLEACPAIVSTYVRLSALDDVLRVDVPAYDLGLDSRVADHQMRWLSDPQQIEPVLRQLIAAYGGQTVYNAPLYAVDKRVRLSLRTVERVYLPILARHAGVRLQLDRGRRRFAT